MQGIRQMHCTIWTEGVREIISAEECNVKFIISDHPVTIYNHAVPPDHPNCNYPNDPDITLKSSQTIFPLNRDFCLILTNLEYAQDPSVNPIQKRTFPRHYRESFVRTDTFIRSRKLTSYQVAHINSIIKRRARRYIAAGQEEWLYPEEIVSSEWSALQETLLPPEKELWHFGGELYAGFENGRVYYQDAFGRTEKPRDFLLKSPPPGVLRPGDTCGCGSGLPFKACCKSKPVSLRPTWTERSIRERNLMLYSAVTSILGLDQGKDWLQVRRDLTDDQISEVYFSFEALWPLETDLFQLLPKPDGTARAVYTGSIHPETITEFALGASLYFGDILVEYPFTHAGTVRKEFSPVDNPQSYRQEFLKSTLLFLTIMPLVDRGLVILVPDPCNFDTHLRDQTMHMARERTAGLDMSANDVRKGARLFTLMRDDLLRNLLSLPEDSLRTQLQNMSPDIDEVELEGALKGIEELRTSDPLATLRNDEIVDGKGGGQLSLFKLAPNFEITMYLAQATGSCIVTDSAVRWTEVKSCSRRQTATVSASLPTLTHHIEQSEFLFPQDVADIASMASQKAVTEYAVVMRKTFKYLSKLGSRGAKPNLEAHLAARFARIHGAAQAVIKKACASTRQGKISCVFSPGGIHDNTVNRLLLMSSSEHHLRNVPMAFFIDGSTLTT